MKYLRPMTPTEWFYACMEPQLPPFAIQLRIALTHLPSLNALTQALIDCAAVNPAARMRARGRWWWDAGLAPAVVCIDGGTPFSLQHPALRRRLPADAPPIEVLWWPGVGLVLRCAHALMDAAGLLHFAKDLFRALRGDPLLGSRADLNDWHLLVTSPHRHPLKALRPAWPSPAGTPSKTSKSGYLHALRQIRGRVDSPTARIAAALARAQADGVCRLMIPVDLRLAEKDLLTTANLSNPLILDFEANWNSTVCWRHMLGALARHEQFGVWRNSKALTWLPARVTGRFLGMAQDWQVRHGRHLFTALSSNLARIPLAAFAFNSEVPSQVGFLPFDTPGAGLNLLTLQHDDALELAASCPAAAGDDGRLERLLDQVCAELERGVVKPAAKSAVAQDGPAIVIAATFVAEPLAGVLAWWMKTFGLALSPVFAPYNQVLQMLSDPHSLFANNSGGVNLVLLRLEDWCRSLSVDDPAELRMSMLANMDELLTALAQMAARGVTALIAWLAPLSDRARQHPILASLHESVARALADMPGLCLLEDGKIRHWYPVAQEDAKLSDYLGHIPFSRDRYAAIASALARTVVELVGPPLKVIVVDCDNTLWRGACAELGPLGVEVTPAYGALQTWLIAQVEAGRLVCLGSRNEPADVDAVFAQNPGMLLRPEHIVAHRINWHSKSENLRALAAELRLGLDSLVFIDDNPVECAEVQMHCPDAQVLCLPNDSADIPAWLEHLWTLEPVVRTAMPRTQLYRQESQREALRTQTRDFQTFLDSLQLQVTLARPQGTDWERVAELSRRTSQFNLVPRPRPAAYFQGVAQCLAVFVADRFGDYGLSGALTWHAEGKSLRIDAWMLSCRVLGRGVEQRVLAALGDLAIQAECDELIFNFEATARNTPARAFLESACERQQRCGREQFRVSAQHARVIGAASAPTPMPTSMPGLDADAPPGKMGMPEGVLDFIARTCRDLASIQNAASGESASAWTSDKSASGDRLPALRALAHSLSDGALWEASPDESLVELGLDSLQVVMLLGEAARIYCRGCEAEMLEAGLGRFLDKPTLRELALIIQRFAQEQGA